MSDNAEMLGSKSLSQIYPGRGLGWLTLGASLHGVLSRLKAQPHIYRQIELSYSSDEPISEPVVLSLHSIGIRLRFDGPDQRLRLIEIIDFATTTFTYKNIDVVRRPTQTDPKSGPLNTSLPGPSFRHVYNRLFGPAYAGEYIAPQKGMAEGTYVLSYPGLAVRFSLRHKSYSDKADFVSLLTSAASPALSIAIFSGSSWPEARGQLYTRIPPLPRSLALAGKNTEGVPDEIEQVVIHGGGRMELIRRTLPPVDIILSQTTPQDLVAELGPPDAIFKKTSSRLSIHAASQTVNTRASDISPGLHPSSVDSNRSLSAQSLNSGLDDDSESEALTGTEDDSMVSNMFYNYFHHGFDVLVSYPGVRSPAFPKSKTSDTDVINEPLNSTPNGFGHNLVATKVFLHGNVPGSYSFNRHRRCRWMIQLPSSVEIEDPEPMSQLQQQSTSASNTKRLEQATTATLTLNQRQPNHLPEIHDEPWTERPSAVSAASTLFSPTQTLTPSIPTSSSPPKPQVSHKTKKKSSKKTTTTAFLPPPRDPTLLLDAFDDTPDLSPFPTSSNTATTTTTTTSTATNSSSPSPPHSHLYPHQQTPKQVQSQTKTKIQTHTINNLTSEDSFSKISSVLTQLWSTSSSRHTGSGSASASNNANPNPGPHQNQKPMVLNRGWGSDPETSSPDASIELLGGTMTINDNDNDNTNDKSNNSSSSLPPPPPPTTTTTTATTTTERNGNTHLYGFPGLLFEVLKSDHVGCVTIY